jgi:hypothetical protein
MSLEIAELKSLLPHEEVVPAFLEKLSQDIEKDGFLKHPIIIDRDSKVILDGNHRTEAMKKLGYDYIPVCAVDYGNPLIQVKCWYRAIGKTSQESSLNTFMDLRESDCCLGNINEMVGSRRILAIAMKKQILVSKQYSSILELYKALQEVEIRLRELGFRISYLSEEAACEGVVQGDLLAYIAISPLTKEIIVETSRCGQRLPCKTSRHIFPARPMCADFPLQFLKDRSLDEANRTFHDWLSKKKVEQTPPGTIFEGRKYDERIYVFKTKQV